MGALETDSDSLFARQIYFLERFHSAAMAWVILGISLLLTVTAYFASREIVAQRLHDQFEFRAHEISRAIEDRLYVYEQILWSGVALFYASPGPQLNVTREQWHAFVAALDINKHWPGIQGIGYSIPVTPLGKANHTETIRAEGFPEYQIRPEGERDEYSAIVYLEPFDWRNKRAFGYDMWSNPMRRDAMKRARDQGVASTSGIITLVQETDSDVQRGFLTYVPVYSSRRLPKSVAERKRQFEGWVYAPFRAADLMAGILGSKDTNLVFDVYDGPETTSKALLYSSLKSENNKEIKAPVFTQQHTITLQGRPWTIAYRTPPNFKPDRESSLPTLVALVGLVIDVLLFYVIWSLTHVGHKAKKMADQMTVDLRTSKADLEEQVCTRTQELQFIHQKLETAIDQRTAALQAKVRELEKMDQLTSDRELRVIELKQEVNTLLKELGRAPLYDSHEMDETSELGNV